MPPWTTPMSERRRPFKASRSVHIALPKPPDPCGVPGLDCYLARLTRFHARAASVLHRTLAQCLATGAARPKPATVAALLHDGMEEIHRHFVSLFEGMDALPEGGRPPDPVKVQTTVEEINRLFRAIPVVFAWWMFVVYRARAPSGRAGGWPHVRVSRLALSPSHHAPRFHGEHGPPERRIPRRRARFRGTPT